MNVLCLFEGIHDIFGGVIEVSSARHQIILTVLNAYNPKIKTTIRHLWEGNYFLRSYQYGMAHETSILLARILVIQKIMHQRHLLTTLKDKSPALMRLIRGDEWKEILQNYFWETILMKWDEAVERPELERIFLTSYLILAIVIYMVLLRHIYLYTDSIFIKGFFIPSFLSVNR